MDSPALEVSAETNHNAHTGNEYTQKKQRTEASEVTDSLLMGIFWWKVLCFGVVRVAHFLRTLAKLPVGWLECNIQILPLVSRWFKWNFGTCFIILSLGMVGEEHTPSYYTHFKKWHMRLFHNSKIYMSLIFESFFLMNFDCFRSFHQLPLILVATLPPGLTWASPTPLYSSWCSFLWRWCTMHQICPMARTTSSISVRASSVTRQIIKGMIIVGHLPIRGDVPAGS